MGRCLDRSTWFSAERTEGSSERSDKDQVTRHLLGWYLEVQLGRAVDGKANLSTHHLTALGHHEETDLGVLCFLQRLHGLANGRIRSVHIPNRVPDHTIAADLNGSGLRARSKAASINNSSNSGRRERYLRAQGEGRDVAAAKGR